jgi:hypothetical protein
LRFRRRLKPLREPLTNQWVKKVECHNLDDTACTP